MKESPFQYPCPQCGSHDIAGLVNAFWVTMKDDETPVEGWHLDVGSETEVGERRMCGRCHHEWEL